MQVAEGEAQQAEADAAQVQQSALLLQKALMASAESELHRQDAAAATVAIKMLQAEAAAVNIAALQAKAEVRSMLCCAAAWCKSLAREQPSQRATSCNLVCCRSRDCPTEMIPFQFSCCMALCTAGSWLEWDACDQAQ